eukprot:457229-Prorocentrum_lima.AAC.1
MLGSSGTLRGPGDRRGLHPLRACFMRDRFGLHSVIANCLCTAKTSDGAQACGKPVGDQWQTCHRRAK